MNKSGSTGVKARREWPEGGVTRHLSLVLQDFRIAARTLRKQPGFTLVATGLLAVGIAATASLFMVIKGLLLDPLPYPEPDRLAQVWTKDVDALFDYLPLSTPDFQDLKERTSSFEAFGAFGVRRFNLGGERPESVEGAVCTPGLFNALGVQPRLGRWFTRGDLAGNETAAVILSSALWKQRYESDPDCIGRSIRIDGREHTIVGVMPPHFELLSSWTRNRTLSLWTALDLPANSGDRRSHWLASIARLKPGVSADQASAELRAAAKQIRKSVPNADLRKTFWLMPLAREIGGMPALRLSVLLAAGWTLLVLAGQNVAGMLLTRGLSRQSEMAIRFALGARRRNIVRLVLMESLLLSMIASVCGFVLTLWCMQGLTGILPLEVLPKSGLAIDGWLLGCLVVLALLSTQMSGLTPALLASKTDVLSGLKEGGVSRGVARKTQRKLRNLVVGQIALALLLVSVAVQLAQSYRSMIVTSQQLVSLPVFTAGLAVKGAHYDDTSRAAFWERLLENTAALAGVQKAAVTTQLPLEGGRSMTMLVDNEVYSPTVSRPFTQVTYVSSDYFSAMGLRLLRGRFLGPEDTAERWRHRFVVVNRALAERYWPGQNPLGHHIRQDVAEGGWSAEVVGVTEDVRQVAERPARPEMYFPYADSPHAEAYLVVRTPQGAPTPVEAIRKELHALDPDLALAQPKTMADRFEEDSRVFTVVTSIVNALTVAILVLAGVGLYGTLSFYFAQRRHDIGIRMAMGAGQRHIMLLVFRQALGWVAAGTAVGLAGAWVLSRGIQSFLQDSGAFNPAQAMLNVAVVLCTALLASWLPARRAAKVDPMAALRAE